MEIIFYVLIVILALVIMSILNEQSIKKGLRITLKNEWGKVPKETYTSEKFEALKKYYLAQKDDILDVDEITWHDLDMDEIYMLMNNTQCGVGEEYLYAFLRKPCFSDKELEERNRLMNYFEENEEQRISIQSILHQIGKLSKLSIYDYINRFDNQKAKSNLVHYALNLCLICSALLIFIYPSIGGVSTLAFVAINVFWYYKERAVIEKYLMVFSFIFRLLDGIKKLYQLDIPELQKYTDQLKKDLAVIARIRRGSFLLAPTNSTGSLVDLFFDYIRMLFHVDIIKYNSMLKHFKKNVAILNRIYQNVGYLDSLIAAASFRRSLEYYCEPELTRSGSPKLTVTDLYHPLIDSPVTNSISEKRSVLITGSNASGKSTFIKTLAINAILSQTIYTSTSKNYKASYFLIYSSMALRDSLFNKESYYIVEIKSLKRILERVNKDIPMLCFIDEVLRGTNTLERIAASSRILCSLAKKNTLVFAATHDIELTHILENYFSNYHFQERIVENEILFDYKLYQGKAISKNAIKLLNMLGYPKEIILSAEKAAEEFQTIGEWSKLRV